MLGVRGWYGQGDKLGVTRAPGNWGAMDVCTSILIVGMVSWVDTYVKMD